MVLNILVETQEKATDKKATIMTQLINYLMTFTKATLKYIWSSMILDLYSDAYYLLDPNEWRHAIRFFLIRHQHNNLRTHIPPQNVVLHIDLRIMGNLLASNMEVELEATLENFQSDLKSQI